VFHTGNYTEIMQEVTINGSFPAAILRVIVQPSSVGPAAYP